MAPKKKGKARSGNPGTQAAPQASQPPPGAGLPPTAPTAPPSQGPPAKQMGTPFNASAAHAAIASFDSKKEERSATMFDVNFNTIQALVQTITDASQDAVTRMGLVRDPLFFDEVRDSLELITDYHIAAKLLATCTQEQKAELGPFKALESMLDAAPLPTPISDVVQLFGNFATTEEDWQLSNIRAKVLALLQRPPADVDFVQVNLGSQVSELERDFGKQLDTLPLNFNLNNAVVVQIAPDGVDWTNIAQTNALHDNVEAGAGRGQQADVTARVALHAFFTAGVIPPAAAQAAIIAAFQLVFNRTLVFSANRPSAIKEVVGANIGNYSRLYRSTIERVWVVRDARSYTEEGSPAQLLSWTHARTAARSPLDAVPADYAVSSLVTMNPRVVRRPHAWSMTQSSAAMTIQETIFSSSRKAE